MIHSRVLIDNSKTSGIVVWHHFDDVTGEVTYEDRYDLQNFLDVAAMERSADEQKDVDWGRKVASIPGPMYYELKRKGIIEKDDPKQTKLMKWIMDPDNAKFRIWGGRLA